LMGSLEESMGKRNTGPLPAAVDHLREAVQTWRATRAYVGPMPVALWERAVRLAEAHGTCRIARAVHLDYCSLREQAEVLATRSLEPAFLEIPAALVLAGSANDGASPEVDAGHAETLIDIALADGSQLRMRGRSLDTAGIVAAFMGRR